jgi:hypothetical protein
MNSDSATGGDHFHATVCTFYFDISVPGANVRRAYSL